MADNQNLRDALRQVARAVRTAPERQKDAAVFAAFDAAGGVKPEALQRALPPLMLTWWLPGAVSAGSNVGKEVHVTGAIRLQDISVRAKTAPVGSECKVRLTANGAEIESVAIRPGQTFGRSTIASASAERAAGETLRVDIVTASGAADVTVTLRYSLTGTSHSGGSSSGGGSAPVVSSVSSVNGQTGVVTLNADDINDDTTSHKFVSSADLAKLAGISGTNTGDQDLSGYALTSSLSGVALSGAYADLTGKPTIPTTLAALDTTVTGAQLNALKTKVDGIASGATANATDAQLRDRATHTGAQAISSVTGLQTAIDGKASTSHTHGVSDLTATGTRNSTTILYGDNTWKAAPSGGGGGVTDHTLLTNIGTNTHAQIDTHIASTANPHSVTKSQVGLANVDNTSDANKPVSTAQATAINAKADTSALTAHTGNTSNPHSVTKAQVGLGSVDNTSDASKPISTATQTALNLKADKAETANAMLASTRTTTSVTAGDVIGMAFAIGANETWTAEFNLNIGCNNTGGVKFALTAPAGAAFRAPVLGTGTSITTITSSVLTASGTLTTQVYNTFSGLTGSLRITVGITNGSTAGNVQLQFASGVAGQTSSVTVYSYLTARKV